MPDTVRRLDFLGKGVSFPFHFTRRTGGVYQGSSVTPSEQIQHVTESIIQILNTQLLSRVIRRDFGSRMRSIIFDPNDPFLDTQVEYIVRTAIETWEPRVIVGPVYVDHTEFKRGRVEITINIRIRRTNVSKNIVFPYFLTEEQRKTFVPATAS